MRSVAKARHRAGYIIGHVKSLHLFSAVLLMSASWSVDAVQDLSGMAKVLQLPVSELQSKMKEAVKNPARFALPIPASITLEDGKWTDVDGVSTWKVVLTTPGAMTVSFLASDIALPVEARLLIAGKDRPMEQASHLYKRGRFLSSIVRGDVLAVEIVTPTRRKSSVRFFIEEVQMGYKGLLKGTGNHPEFTRAVEVSKILESFAAATANAARPKAAAVGPTGNGGTPPPPGLEPSDEDCYRNFSCYKDEFNTAIGDAVAALIIANQSFCTGSLIHDSARSFKPFLITAEHCIEDLDPSSVEDVNIQWKSEVACGSDAYYQQVVGEASTQGAAFRMKFSDTLLYEASAPPPSSVNPYWLGFDASGEGKGCVNDSVGMKCSIGADQRLHQIHHGRVLPRSYAYSQGADSSTLGNEFVGFRYTWRVNNDLSVTGGVQGGSSGSSLVLGTRSIGVLTGGAAQCTSTFKGASNPLYDRLMDAWVGGGTPSTSAKAWLDPANTGILVQDGSRQSVAPVIPTVSLTLDRSSVNPGQSATLTNRSTNAASCSVDSAFTGVATFPTDGSSAINVPSSATPGTYPLAVECTSSTGSKASQSINLTVVAPAPQTPTVNFSLDRTSAAPGDVVVGSVTSTNAVSCTLTSPITTNMSLPLNGNANITLSSSAANGNYSLTAECTSSGEAKASRAAQITISAPTTPPPSGPSSPTVSVGLDRASAAPGSVIRVFTNSTNANSCTLSSPITPTRAVSISGFDDVEVRSSTAAGNYTITVQCSSSSGASATGTAPLNISVPVSGTAPNQGSVGLASGSPNGGGGFGLLSLAGLSLLGGIRRKLKAT